MSRLKELAVLSGMPSPTTVDMVIVKRNFAVIKIRSGINHWKKEFNIGSNWKNFEFEHIFSMYGLISKEVLEKASLSGNYFITQYEGMVVLVLQKNSRLFK